MNGVPVSQSTSAIVLTLLTVLLLTVSSSLQPSMIAFAQAASLADEIIDETATSVQDSSSDDNVQENDNDFGDDATIADQDNEADEDAANLGLQDQDATQDIAQEQDAVNFNFDFDVQRGLQIEREPPVVEEEPPTQPPGTTGEPVPPGPIGPPPEEEGVFCVSAAEETLMHIICFNTKEECEEFRANPIGSLVPISECERFEEPPPGALEPPPSP